MGRIGEKTNETSANKKAGLGNLVIEERNKIEISVLEKLVDSVPSRLYECILIKRYSTKYQTDNALFASSYDEHLL